MWWSTSVDKRLADWQEDRNAVDTVWADATVPYTISPELGGFILAPYQLWCQTRWMWTSKNSCHVSPLTADREENILKAFKMISEVTCIRFKNLTEELNYLIFLDGDGWVRCVFWDFAFSGFNQF